MTNESRDNLEDSHDSREKSCDIEKPQENLPEEQRTIQSISSGVSSSDVARMSSQIATRVSTCKSTQPNNAPQHRSNSSSSTHQSWPVMSLLSGARSTSTSDNLSKHSNTPLMSTNSILQRVSETPESNPLVRTTPTCVSSSSVSQNITRNSSSARTANHVSYPSTYSSVQSSSTGSISSSSVQHQAKVSSSHTAHRSSNTHQRAVSAHIVQPWVDGRSLTNAQHNQTYSFNPFHSVETATSTPSSALNRALARRGLVSDCASDHSPSSSYLSPAPRGGSLVSSSGYFPTYTIASSTDNGDSFKPSQDSSMSMLTRTNTASERQSYTRYRPYTSRPSTCDSGSTHSFTQARQESLSHETRHLSAHTHSGQFVQRSGHMGAYSNHHFQHSIVDSRMSHDRGRMSHDRSFSIDYTNQPLFSFTGSNENSAYRHSQRVSSHGNHVMSYGTTATPPYPENQVPIQPTDGSVWRPYSEPHRMSGFGLSDILSHTEGGNHSLHLEPTPQLPVNRMHSFLVDRLLDDI